MEIRNENCEREYTAVPQNGSTDKGIRPNMQTVTFNAIENWIFEPKKVINPSD